MSNVTILIILIKFITFCLVLIVSDVLFFTDFLGSIGVFYFVVSFVVVFYFVVSFVKMEKWPASVLSS